MLSERWWGTRRPEEGPDGDGGTPGAPQIHDSVRGDGGRDKARVHGPYICHADEKKRLRAGKTPTSERPGYGKRTKALYGTTARAARRRKRGRERGGGNWEGRLTMSMTGWTSASFPGFRERRAMTHWSSSMASP